MRSSPYFLILSRIATMLLTIVTTTLVARSIGPTGRGLSGSGTALAALLPIVAAWGIPIVVRRQAATADWRSVLRSARRAGYFMVVPMGLAGWAFAVAIMPELTTTATVMFVALSAAAGLQAHAMSGSSVLIVQRRFFAVAVLQALQILVASVGLVALYLLVDITVAGVFACQCVGVISTWMFGLIVLRGVSGTRDGLIQTMSRGSRYLASSVLDAASLRLDQVLVLPIVGSTQAGYHSVAIAVGTPLLALGHAVGTASFRLVAQARADARTLARSSVRGSLVVAVVLALPAACAMPFLVPLVFGAEFRPAVAPAALVCLAAPAVVANYVAGQALAALGLSRRLTAMWGLIVGVVAAGLIIFGHPFGATGTAAAFGAGQFVGTVYAWWALRPEGAPARTAVRADIIFVLRTLRRG